MSRQPFFIGINDPVGLNPTGASFNPNVFTVLNGWRNLVSSPTMAATLDRAVEFYNTRG